MATTTISLPDDQLARLRQHAVSSGRSLDDVVSEAVDAYLTWLAEADAHRVTEPPSAPAQDGWEPETRLSPDGFRLRIPADMTPDEAEAYAACTSPAARRTYLANWLIGRGARVTEPPPGPPDPEWQAEVEAALARIRARVPADMTSEEIEQLITEGSEEARQERIANRAMDRGARVIEPSHDIPDEEWRARFDAVTKRIRQAGPTDLTPEEIEREITLAREEARRALSSG